MKRSDGVRARSVEAGDDLRLPRPARQSPAPAKPVSAAADFQLTRVPRLGPARGLARRLIYFLAWLAGRLFLRVDVAGRENIPAVGPALIVMNHLADADPPIVFLALRRTPEAIAKIELRQISILRWLLDAYGVIYVRRGQPDRRALRAALECLERGRMLLIAPEGRESLAGALEHGTPGAAYLALKSGAPVLPVALAGSQAVYARMRRLRRTDVRVRIGRAFVLSAGDGRRAALERGTERIMRSLAELLPPEYRGMYPIPEAEAR